MEYNFRIDKTVYDSYKPLFLGYEDCKKGHSFGPAVRKYWILHYVISGKGKYVVGDNEYNLRPGQAFLIRPGEITLYTADSKDPWCYSWFAFSGDETALSRLPYIIESRSLSSVMEKIVKDNLISGEDNTFYFAHIFFKMLNCLFPEGQVAKEGYTQRAINIIRQEYMNPVTIGGIASALGLERSYFSNLFKNETGKSPMQYLSEYRMKTALAMLREEKYSISVIAASVGYNDLFGFSRYFKKYYGVAPREFKKIV